jgi:alpha-beta hydrolase superfamily lysophospholipase
VERLSAQSKDGTRLNLVRWEPPGEVRADVVLIGGLAEHLGRYDHVAAALTAAGFRVTGVEPRGHGNSDGKRGHVDQWRRYCEDLRAAQYAVDGPHFLVAHSMGGLIALDALRKPVGPEVRGLVLSDPLLRETVAAPRIKVAAAGLLSRFLPRLALSNELDTSAISRDPDVVRRYEQDPLVYSTITPRWFTEMKAAQARVWEGVGAGRVPLLMLVGGGDRICSPDGNREFAERWGGPKEVRTYPGLYHELMNEPEKDAVLRDIVDWLAGRA